jgi:hypothetical protein
MKTCLKEATDYAAQFTYQRAFTSPRQMNKSKFLLVIAGCEEVRYRVATKNGTFVICLVRHFYGAPAMTVASVHLTVRTHVTT